MPRLPIALLLLTITLSAQDRTQVVILGSGTPNADPNRSGPSIAIVVNGSAYLVDAGPGLVRRASAAGRKGITALAMPKLKTVFLTHLHSDHTLGLPDLIYSPWTLERTDPIRIFGPPGTRAMVHHIEKAWKQDVHMRLTGGEPSNKTGYRALATEIKPGVVYQDANVKVTAFAVPHGSWKDALGYRFDTKDRSVVISGDTTYSPELANVCSGCDVLLHEVYSQPGFDRRTPDWQAYHSRYHTSSRDVARVATAARPKLLVLYHQLFWGTAEEDLVREVQQSYDGKTVSARDLEVYE